MQTVKPESVGMSSDRLLRLGEVMQSYIDRQAIAGMTALVARHGQVAFLEALGWQDMEEQRPMSLDTIFRIYSMTKPITSAAVMMLCEEGRLRLVDPVWRHIPEFKDLKVMVPRSGCDYDLVPARREVTIHDLMTHSGGLSYGDDEHSALDELYRTTLDRLDAEGEPALEKRVKALAELPLAFQPGSGFRYSFSTDVLGYVVQLVSGRPFEDFLQSRIFDPLGMVDTSFWVPPEKMARLAVVYEPAEGGALKAVLPPAIIPVTRPPRNPSGGGGLVSTARDYFRFGQMLLNGGALDGVRLLGRKTVEWMLQNHLPEDIHPFEEPAFGFGLGGSVLIHPGQSPRPGSVGKFGWSGIASTDWFIDPVEDLLCLLFLQYLPMFALPIREDFTQVVYAALE